MFLRRCFLSSTRSLSLPTLSRFSSSVSVTSRRRDYMPSSDCRAIPLRDRVDFLIRLPDLDTAAKHARLAPYAELDDDERGEKDDYAVDWVCGAIIVAMCKAKRYNEALDLIRYFFNEHKMIPPKGSFNHVLKGALDDSSMTLLGVNRLARSGCFDQAMDPFKYSRNWFCGTEPFGMCLDVSTSLIRGLLDLGDLEEAHKLFREISMRNGHNDLALAGATFMEYWFKQGKEQEAMVCYHNLSAMELTEIESTGAIALLEVLLKYGKKAQAWGLFYHLADPGCVRELTYLSSEQLIPTMVNECFNMHRYQDAINIFNTPYSSPETSDYGNIITRLCMLGFLSDAEDLFARMQRNRGKPDLSTYKALMDAYAKAGKMDHVQRISDGMVDTFLSQIAKLSGLSLQDRWMLELRKYQDHHGVFRLSSRMKK